MFDLSGKTALVTGASGAIGAAIARALAACNAKVILSGTRAEALDRVAQDIGDSATVVVADLADEAGCDRLLDQARQSTGGIDVLVANAGITRDGLAMRMSDDDWDKVLTVNLRATFRLSRGALRDMMKKRWGRIIAITSIVGATGNPGQANYAAAKAGLTGMIKSIAQEVAGRGITANCVAPGFIESDMTSVLPEARRAAILAQIPVGRLGQPADVAACVAFLASAEAAYVTGQSLHVNGGLAMI